MINIMTHFGAKKSHKLAGYVAPTLVDIEQALLRVKLEQLTSELNLIDQMNSK